MEKDKGSVRKEDKNKSSENHEGAWRSQPDSASRGKRKNKRRRRRRKQRRALQEVRLDAHGGQTVRIVWKGVNNADPPPPLTSEALPRGTRREQHGWQPYDRLPTITQDKGWPRVYVSTDEGGIPGLMVGPRWRDLNDPTQPWEGVFEWTSRGNWEQGIRPREGRCIKGPGPAISWQARR